MFKSKKKLLDKIQELTLVLVDSQERHKNRGRQLLGMIMKCEALETELNQLNDELAYKELEIESLEDEITHYLTQKETPENTVDPLLGEHWKW